MMFEESYNLTLGERVMSKKFLTVLACSAIVMGLAACGETEVKEVSKDTSTKQEAKKDEKKEAANKVYKAGDTVEINGLQITFNSAKFVEANEYAPAKKGKVLEIEFTAKNNSKKQVYFAADELKIADANGTQFETYFGGDSPFINENIAAGNQIQGKMRYDVAQSEKYTGTYKPSFSLDNKTVKYEFTAQ